MSGGQLTVPLVLRTQGGAGQRGAAQHSQSLESWLTHVPGLKVVMPSRAVDAAGLLATAIADPNPVVFVECKTLYFRKEDAPEQLPSVPLGRASVLREGGDVTIVALSRLVHDALAAAERLAADDGIEAEVIDPRTLVPLDLEAIVASVERTGRLVVAHEAVEHGGFGAEVVARVQEAAFDSLDVVWAGRVVPNPLHRLEGTPSELVPDGDDAVLQVPLSHGALHLRVDLSGVSSGRLPVISEESATEAMGALLALTAGGTLPEVVDGTATNLPLPDDSFDVALATA